MDSQERQGRVGNRVNEVAYELPERFCQPEVLTAKRHDADIRQEPGSGRQAVSLQTAGDNKPPACIRAVSREP